MVLLSFTTRPSQDISGNVRSYGGKLPGQISQEISYSSHSYMKTFLKNTFVISPYCHSMGYSFRTRSVLRANCFPAYKHFPEGLISGFQITRFSS